MALKERAISETALKERVLVTRAVAKEALNVTALKERVLVTRAISLKALGKEALGETVLKESVLGMRTETIALDSEQREETTLCCEPEQDSNFHRYDTS